MLYTYAIEMIPDAGLSEGQIRQALRRCNPSLKISEVCRICDEAGPTSFISAHIAFKQPFRNRPRFKITMGTSSHWCRLLNISDATDPFDLESLRDALPLIEMPPSKKQRCFRD